MNKKIIFVALVAGLALCSCRREDRINSNNHRDNGGSGTSEVTVVETSDWKISVEPRATVSEEGSDEEVIVDIVKVTTNSKSDYYVDAVSVHNFETYYNNDPKAFFDDIISSLGESTLKELLSNGNDEIGIPRLDSGEWIFFAIEIDSNLNYTGYYSSTKVTLPEDSVMSEEFKTWIGVWEVKALNNVVYTLNINSYDNNYKYAVTGWEGDNTWAKEYEIITEFNKADTSMTFYSQVIDTYTDTEANSDVLVYFFGGVDINGSSYIWDYLNEDIAYATLSDDVATVEAAYVEENDKKYPMLYMSFVDYFASSGKLQFYTENSPEFPFTMTRKSGGNTGRSMLSKTSESSGSRSSIPAKAYSSLGKSKVARSARTIR